MSNYYCWFCNTEYNVSELFEVGCHLPDKRKKPYYSEQTIKICSNCMKPQLKLMGYKLVKIKKE
jgi:hypothetical protein